MSAVGLGKAFRLAARVICVVSASLGKGAPPARPIRVSRLRKRFVAAAAVATAVFAATPVLAQSAGCVAVNNGALNYSISTNGTTTSVTSSPPGPGATYDTSGHVANGNRYLLSNVVFAAGEKLQFILTIDGSASTTTGEIFGSVRYQSTGENIVFPTQFNRNAGTYTSNALIGGTYSISAYMDYYSGTGTHNASIAVSCITAVPTVTSLAPASGPIAGTTSVVLTGTNLSGATGVSFGGTPATTFTVNSGTQITATAPAHSAGAVNVTVTTPGGTSATGAGNQYTYAGTPTVTALSPTSGPTGGTTSVVITGTNLSGATAVTFGGSAATTYTVNSGTQITATAPAGTGTVDVRVTTVGGTSATSSADQYTYVAAPTVTGLAPTSGPAAGGTTVVITGTNLSGATAVTFGGAAATTYTVNSGTQITATAPAGTGTVDVRVTTVGGTSATSSADQYTFIPLPTLTINDVTQNEGNSGTTTFTFTVSLSAPANAGGVTFDIATADGTATAPGDYAAKTLTSQTIPAGASSYTFDVAVVGDTTTEANETFGVNVTNVTGATVSDGQGAGTITNDDVAPTLASFTYGSVVAYNPGSTTPTNIDTTAGGVTGSPTAYSVANASGGTYGASAATSGGGAVSINSSGQASYTPRAGYRGNDTFFVRATNASGDSSPATVTVTVGNPDITASLTGSGAAVGTALSGYAVTPDGGNAPYSCVLNAGSAALPSGVTLASNCALSGTPTVSGTFTFNVDITDSSVTGLNGGTASPLSKTNVAIANFAIAQPVPVLSGFTASAVGYGSTGNSINTRTGTGATNNPTAWTVSKTAGGTFAATAESANSAGTANVSINASGGVTYAAPTGFRGNDTFYVRASNAGGNSNVVAVTVPVSNPSLSISLAGSGVRGTPLAGVQVITTGGAVPYTCVIASGALPTGTQLESDCTLSGTPGASGAFNFTATVTDNSTGTGPFTATSGTLTLNVAAPTLAMSPATGALPGATAGASYSQTFTTSGGTASYAYALTAGALPPGLTLTGDTLSGTPNATGTFNFTIRATDSSTGGTGGPYTVSNAYSITVAGPTITIAPVTLTNPTVGAAYTASITASGGGGTYTYARSGGTLPAGLTLAADGTLSGTPTAGGTFNFTVTATDTVTTGAGAPYTGSRAYSITVGAPTITLAPSSLPDGNVATAYSQAITASGGTPTYGYTQTAGALPPGVTLTGGTLSGTPTMAGTFNFTVTATDSSTGTGAPFAGSRAYSLTIGKSNQTITFGALSDASLSASPLTLSATASSGLTVGFTSVTTTICSVTGTTLNLLQTGTCTVNADQAGDANWNAAGQISRSFTVTPATLAITPGAATGLKVGASYSQANPASGGVGPYTYSLRAGAFVPGTTLNSGTGTVSGTPTVAGSFSYIVRVTDSQAPAVTADTPVTTVTIAKGDQTVAFTSAAPGAAAVGGANYNVTASASSGLGVTFSLDGTSTGCTLSGNSVSFIGTGTCRINANQAGDSNWNPAAPVQQSFSIGAAGAISTAVTFAPSALGVGDTGTVTITFTNPNVSTSPDIAPLLSSSALISRSNLGGSCGASGSDAGANFQFNAFAIPSGSCTVTLDYTGTTPGASSGVVLGAFTPSGYPTTGAQSSNAFTVAPTLTAISPSTGPVSQVVTITGTGFSTTPGNNTVNFGAGTGTVTAASATSLTVTTPATGTGTVNVTVTVNGQTSTTGPTFTFIAKPVAADKPGVGVAYNSAGTPIDLSASISGGPHSSIAIGTAAAHGTTSIAGDVVTYTPTAGYYGADSFTYTATGAGGTSNVATVSITVATPAAPTVADKPGVTTAFNTAVAIDLSGSITGVHSSIAVSTAPAHGTTSIAGDIVTYTPATGYAGADSFAYTATGPGGTSAPAMVSLTVGQGSQTIAFGALPNASLSASPLTLSATASSGLNVSFSSATTTVCTVTGTTLALLQTGTCTINADQAGNSSYTAAPRVTQSFQVTPANLTITPNAATGLKVGASYSQANPASGGVGPYTYSLGAGAFVPGTTLNSGTGTVSGTPTVAGSFSYIVRVTDSQAPAVTADTPVTTVTIAKGDQTVAFTSTAPGAAAVGGADYNVTASASSGLGVTFSLDGTSTGCTLSGNSVSFIGTGTCRINANQAGDSNWNPAAPVQQSLIVGAGQAVGLSVAYSPSTLTSGEQGTLTITFTNGNAQTTPAFSSTLHSNNIVFSRLPGLNGSCGIPSGNTSVPNTATVVFSNITIPTGTCTVTLTYQAVAPGTASWTFDGFTPSGYPATAGATSNTATVLPSVTSISPSTGPVSQVVTIAGTGFSTTPGNNTVKFGAANGTVTAASATSLTVTAPATGTGTVDVTVTVNGQTSATGPTFTFLAPPVAADKPGVAVPFDTATAIDLSGSITGGAHSSIAIGTAPAHGTVTIAGDVVTYTPAAGYFGGDSFTYTATGAGGTSNVATVSLTVATPPAPTVTDKTGVAVPYNSAGTAIDLSGSITGIHGVITIATAPAHGTVTTAGGSDVVVYTPAAGYYGADSFAFTTTGPGGTPAPATVSLTVGNPPAPTVADKTGVAVPYNSTGTAIDMSGSVTGVHSSIAVAIPPAHGTVTIAGDVITYTPTTGYFGVDNFTYTATGPGGTSPQALVSVTVATPAAPTAADKTGVAVPYNSTGTAIDLSGSITGVHTSIAVGTAPAHGTVTIAGDVVTYTPTAGYFGADTFTYTATGPGGTSAAATVSLTVATPPAPVVASKSGVAVPYNGTGTAIDLTASITGIHTSIAIAAAPTHGTVTIAGDVVTYTPTAGYFGTDSFAYTATGPGGTSAPATVSLTVATPAAPTVANKSGVAVPYNSAGTAIDLTASITGVHSAITVATAPQHGTTTVAGDVVTYKPTAGYYGADSFTYTATGPGGTSAAATVSLTVATPPAPTVADKSGVAVPYGTATAIDLTASVTGVHSALAIGTAPQHGTVSIAGDVITYTPTAGYAGPDSFTYTATGPGGASAAATVTLTVGSPTVAITTDALPNGRKSVAYFTTTLTASGGAAPYSFRISQGTLPGGMTLTSAGVLSGTPTEFGSFPITVSATDSSTGAGPFTATRNYTIMIAAPFPPVARDGPNTTVASSTVTNNQSVEIDLSALVTGEYTDIRIDTQPQHGTVKIRSQAGQGGQGGQGALSVSPQDLSSTGRRFIATYTPATGYHGQDRFTFVAVGPGGQSAAAAVQISVTGLKPVAPILTETATAGVPVTVDLTTTAREAPFTGATIVSVTPSGKATARLIEGGTAQARTYNLEIQTDGHFGGTVVVTYTLTNAFGTSDPATVTLTVNARPDPSSDPTVRGISDAQAEAARRFGRVQLDNFQRRNEQLHNGGKASRNGALGVQLTGGDRMVRQRPGTELEIPDAMALKMEHAVATWGAERAAGAMALQSRDGRPGEASPAAMISGMRAGMGMDGASIDPAVRRATGDGDSGERKIGSGAIWSGGALEVGVRDETTRRRKLSLTSAGLSAGLDVKLADGLILGAGGGYGTEGTDIGDDGRMDARNWVGVVYGSYRPARGAFIDMIAGAGGLDFKTRRLAANGQVANGNRDGTLRFGSMSFGYDGRGELWQISAYGRVDYVSARLGQYSETGAGIYSLRFDRRDINSLSSVLGARASTGVPMSIGLLKPRGRFEWRHEFQDAGTQYLDYADLVGSTYRIVGDGWLRDEFSLELGFGLDLEKGWNFGIDVGGRKGQGSSSATVRASVSTQF